jgi:mono/diheme cytochrome c family protein
MTASPRLIALVLAIATSGGAAAQELPDGLRTFVANHCLECHDSETAKGGLDLAKAGFALDREADHAMWVEVHDRVAAGEMPPAKRKERPAAGTVQAFLAAIAPPLIAADQARAASEGRATWRRLNRYEYEHSLRDLLQAPWLQVKSFLPEDGEAHRFNKIGDALDISHVQMAQYLAAAEYALREVMGGPVKPASETRRHYARDQGVFAKKMLFNEFNRAPERATFPVLGFAGQPEVRSGKLPLTKGDRDPATRELEAMGTVASSYEPIELRFDRFKAPMSGRYRLRLNAYSVWVGPGKEKPKDPKKEVAWWRPDLDDISPGRRSEPVTISSESPPRQVRWQGAVEVGTEPAVHELEVWLLKGETIRVDAARLFRSRPPGSWRNPLATREGQPGVAFRWLEVEGPLIDAWPTAGHRLLCGDLEPRKTADGTVELHSADPLADAERLLRAFMARAYRRPVEEADVQRFLAVIRTALAAGNGFTDALVAGYTGVLCSPGFIGLQERPGPLDDHALAARLSYFLWNSEPDAELRRLAEHGELRANLTAQTGRLLADARSQRFVDALLDYWLDLRHIDATSPDAGLYPDYYLDDLLVESALRETRLFFAELVRGDLPARNVVASDFAMLNERLASHYGLPPVAGVGLRRVPLPADGLRGGLMTQASVLKVTANGTTTSPVVRGAWIMERILGLPPPPPPPNVPAVEPDIRGAKTIREQLAKHRSAESCAACHARIDPAGFALEQFDVMGGWRERYRATGDGRAEVGYGKNGQPFEFHLALAVDASGTLPDGRAFTDVRALKKLLLADERLIARNLARQLTVYATGAPVRFADRAQIERILDRAAGSGYGVHSLIEAIVASPLFLTK